MQMFITSYTDGGIINGSLTKLRNSSQHLNSKSFHYLHASFSILVTLKSKACGQDKPDQSQEE